MGKNRWARLSQSEKAELLGIYANGGWTKLDDIIADYNSYGNGGPEKQNWFTRVTMNAMLNGEAPVATAAGWTRDRNGNVVQTEQDSEGVKQLRNNLAVLGATGLGVFTGGAAMDLAATELGTYGNIYKGVAKRFLRDLPAFEFFDRLPTVFGDQRFTEYGTQKAEQGFRWLMPEGKFTDTVAPYVGNIVGAFAGGAAPGIASDMAMNAGSRAIVSGLNRAGHWITDQFKFNTSDVAKVLDSIKKVNPDTERSISRSFTDKDKFRSLVKRLEDYEAKNGAYNVAPNTYWANPYQYNMPNPNPNHLYIGFKAKRSNNPFVAAMEADLDNQALHGGFKYDDIYVSMDGFISGKRPTLYKEQNPITFFDAAEDRGFDTSQLLKNYEDYVNLLTNPSEYRALNGSPKEFVENLSAGRTSVGDYRRQFPGTIVDENGNINGKELAKAYKMLLENLEAEGYVTRGYNGRAGHHGLNEKYNSSGKTSSLKEHIAGVVKTAQEIPVPKGSSRQELVRAALVHDIGKLVTGQEAAGPFARHAVLGEELLRTIPELREFSSPQIRSSVLMHMDDSITPIYKSHGVETLGLDHPFRIGLQNDSMSSLDEIPLYPVNYDLLHALQASDVARGLSYDQAATKFPQLFTYDKEVPFNVKMYQGTPEEQLKNVVNPLLKRQGYPTVKNAGELETTMRRHRSFLRGVRDPYKTAPDADMDGAVQGIPDYYPLGTLEDRRNAIGAAESALKYYGINTPDSRLLVSEGVIPKYSTGHGRASLFGSTRGWYNYTTEKGAIVGGDVMDNAPGLLSKYLKVSPEHQDAMYVSASPSVLREYSTSWKNPREGMAARVTIPNEPIKPGESLADFYERSNFQLYAGYTGGGRDIASSAQPMSNFQLFEEPYRLQTGRSLQSDMAKEYLGNRMSKVQHSAFFEDPFDIAQFEQQRESLLQLGNKFGVDFSNMYPEIVAPSGNKGILAHKNAAAKLGDVVALYEHDGGTGLGLSVHDAKHLVEEGLLSKKTFDLYSKISNQYYRTSMSKPTGAYDTKRMSDWESRMAKQKDNLAKFATKYILNKNTLTKAKSQYFKAVKPTYELSKEYVKYMHDPENIIKFMRDKGVAPLYEMPSFGKAEVFSTNGQGWGYGPKTRNFAPSKNASQGIIIGNRGEKVLDVQPFTQEEIDQLYAPLHKNYGRYRSGARDAGERFTGEEDPFAITRKTFGSGGSIHIKPENRGKFTALKKRTGHSASWFKAHGTPAQKKMAVFALNARKWKHADGGPLEITSHYIPDPQMPIIQTVGRPTAQIKIPEAKVQTPITFDLAPEIYNMVPLMYDIPTVTVPFLPGQEVEQLDPVKDAARRIRAVENSKTNPNGGWNEKEKRWYPHKSVEGGADTIAYGIKLSNGTPEAELAKKQGYLTDDQAIHFTDSLAQVYYDKAKGVYDKKYGNGEWDKLSPESQSFLTDFSYNPGLGKFPKLMEGFHSGNIDMIRENYMRYSNGKPLGRNKTMLEEVERFANDVPIFRKCGGRIKKNGGELSKFSEVSSIF